MAAAAEIVTPVVTEKVGVVGLHETVTGFAYDEPVDAPWPSPGIRVPSLPARLPSARRGTVRDYATSVYASALGQFHAKPVYPAMATPLDALPTVAPAPK